MLVVTVELWPGGEPARAIKIAEAQISNISDLAGTSDYEYSLSERESPLVKAPLNSGGQVLGHDRKQTVWALIHRVLGSALANR